MKVLFIFENERQSLLITKVVEDLKKCGLYKKGLKKEDFIILNIKKVNLSNVKDKYDGQELIYFYFKKPLIHFWDKKSIKKEFISSYETAKEIEAFYQDFEINAIRTYYRIDENNDCLVKQELYRYQYDNLSYDKREKLIANKDTANKRLKQYLLFKESSYIREKNRIEENLKKVQDLLKTLE